MWRKEENNMKREDIIKWIEVEFENWEKSLEEKTKNLKWIERGLEKKKSIVNIYF